MKIAAKKISEKYIIEPKTTDIGDIIENLMEQHKTNAIVDLCKRLNISILTSDLGPEINGFFQRTPCGLTIIHLNQGLIMK